MMRKLRYLKTLRKPYSVWSGYNQLYSMLRSASNPSRMLGCLLGDGLHAGQAVHNLFHAHTAGALDEHHVASANRFLQGVGRGTGIRQFEDRLLRHTCLSGTRRDLSAQLSADDQSRE